MKKVILTIALILSVVFVNAQNKHGVYISNWQSVESPSGVDAGVSVYAFKINRDTNYITSTNKKGTKVYGSYSLGKVYEDGQDSWYYELGRVGKENLIHQGKEVIVFYSKNSFTGKWLKITYILSQSRIK